MTRSLRLRREALSELTTDDLQGVVGGASGLTCPVKECVGDLSLLTCYGSYNCPTYNC